MVQPESEAEPLEAPTSDLGRVIAGRYRIHQLIGEGGMAVVYEGEHTEIGKRVAIKIVHALFSGDDEIVRRFKAEARSASAIESEHIIQVFDAGRDPDIGFFMVMELLKGEDLSRVLGREHRLDPVFACALAKQAAYALEKAHGAGIIHRDLKPANIFLTQRDDGSSTVKLVDFGIAKMLRDARELHHQGRAGITRRGMAIGTPQYMSPEQAQGLDSVDHRTDVYSLGVVLWETIAGQHLVAERPTYEQTILALLSTPAPRLSTVVSEIDPELDLLIAQMLEHDVDKRTPDMRTVREGLEGIYPEIRGSTLKLKSMRPPGPSSADVSAPFPLIAPAPTSPAVTYSTWQRERRKRNLRFVIVAAVALGIGIIVLIVVGPGAREERKASGGAPSSSAAVTIATATASTIASTTASASTATSTTTTTSTATGYASAPRPVGPAKIAPDNSARQVGGAGISSQF